MNEEKQLIAVKLTVDVANKVLQYIGTKPYNEVKELIDMIQKSEPVFAEPKQD